MSSDTNTRREMVRAMWESGIAGDTNQRHADISENAAVVLRRRYLSKDREGNPMENVAGMFQRVAYNLSQAELKYGATEEQRLDAERDFSDVMTHLEFLPNSPTLMNAGRELQQLSACFVIPIEDSLDSIFNQVRATAMIHQSGGGTGFSFSRLRPQGDVVGSTGGVASGPVSFIGAFDSATEVVKQGGTRRGANMAILNVDHPDILRFIHAKENGVNLQNFNISVAVTEEFMERVMAGSDYDLVNPRTGLAVGTLNAGEVFRQIVDLAWQTGDPGIVFLDRINRGNPNPHLGKIESTNPCFAGGMRIATGRGMLTLAELESSQAGIRVLTDNRAAGIRREMAEQEQAGGGTAVAVRTERPAGVTLRGAEPVYLTRRDWPVYRLETDAGYEIIATGDHEFFTPGGLRRLELLQPGEEILIQSGRGVWSVDRSLPPLKLENGGMTASPPREWSRDLGELLGWITGRGRIRHGRPRGSRAGQSAVEITFDNQQAMALAPRFRSRILDWLGLTGSVSERNGTMTVTYRTGLWDLLKPLGTSGPEGPESGVPEAIWAAPRDAVLGYLSALFSAAGRVSCSTREPASSIRLSGGSRRMLQQVQLMLLNEGIAAELHPHQDGHELALHGPNRDAFARSIGFLTPEQQNRATAWTGAGGDADGRVTGLERFTARVETIEYHGTADVYCTTEPETHSVIVNGMVAAQCGEQPLLPYESCNLGSVNLARMVRYGEPGREPGREVGGAEDPGDEIQIDWERLRRVIRTGVRMLDDVIDMNRYPLEQIAEMSLLTRRIGLGVMGWADLLIQLGIRYDSEEAITLAEEVMRFIRDETHAASRELAVDRGAYPAHAGSVYEVQMRNSAPVTIAPTGTISIIAGASSGIEPLFALCYERNVMDNTRLTEANPFFEAVARSQGFGTPELMQTVARTGSLEGLDGLEGLDLPEWVGDIFRVSRDIAPEWHVRMQAAFQAHTDNSVSKTINLPHDATPEDVSEAYFGAYRTGCKGITIYRDGSKADQVLSTGNTPAAAPPAPEARPALMQPVTGRPMSQAAPRSNRPPSNPFRTATATRTRTCIGRTPRRGPGR